MSSYKEKLKEAQGGVSRIKLELLTTLKAKANTVNDPNHPTRIEKIPSFFYYKEGEYVDEKGVTRKGQNLSTVKPVEGIIIGQCMIASCFDQSQDFSYNTSHFFRNNNVVPLFGQTGKVATGTIPELETWISQNSAGRGLTKKMAMFVLTDKGLIEIRTNLTIGIDQIAQYKSVMLDKIFRLTPAMYNRANKDISPRAKEFLNKVADTNPPVYAKIEPIADITDEIAERWKLVEVTTKWLEWSRENGNTPNGVVKEEAPAKREAPAVAPPSNVTPTYNPYASSAPENYQRAANNPPVSIEMPDDDLPF